MVITLVAVAVICLFIFYSLVFLYAVFVRVHIHRYIGLHPQHHTNAELGFPAPNRLIKKFHLLESPLQCSCVIGYVTPLLSNISVPNFAFGIVGLFSYGCDFLPWQCSQIRLYGF
jgi:hypothetical protein